jgi:hypothetical protein
MDKDIHVQPISRGDWIIGKMVHCYREDSWRVIATLDRRTMDKKPLRWFFQNYPWVEFYEGPGRRFARCPHIRRTKGHVYITWSGGWDI